MKRTLLYFGSTLLGLTSVLACSMGGNGEMMEGGRMGGGWMGILFFLAGSFLASLIFWLTYRWVMEYQPKKRR
ncbi:MAG: hypothetical protein AABX70_05690 [Nanoarchaeota archaeon]